VWQLFVSGALRRGLLFLGALMTVGPAIVLGVAFWRGDPLGRLSRAYSKRAAGIHRKHAD
jgi:hypothetical protein